MKSMEMGSDRSEFRQSICIFSNKSAKNLYPPFNTHNTTIGSGANSAKMSLANLSILKVEMTNINQSLLDDVKTRSIRQVLFSIWF